MRRQAFTLIEVLVVLAVLGLLFALLLPAVQAARAAAQRTHCLSHLRQLGVAMHSYHDQYAMYPPANMGRRSFHVNILPFIDQTALHSALPADSDAVREVARNRIALFQCPSDPQSDVPWGKDGGYFPTNYAVNYGTGVQKHGYNGVFRGVSRGPVRSADVTDGLSNTAAIAEILIGSDTPDVRRSIWSTKWPLLEPDQLDTFAHFCRDTGRAQAPPSSGLMHGRNWSEGDPGRTMYNHVLLPNDVSCNNGTYIQEGAFSAGSEHAGGVHVLFGDGHAEFVSTHIDFSVWRAHGSRNGAEVIP